MNDGKPTSELLSMPMGVNPQLSAAEIGVFYFGVHDDSDLSFLLYLKGSNNRYSSGATFGVRMYAGDTALSVNKYRQINTVKQRDGKEILQFSVLTEELAWLVAAQTAKIEIYDVETEKKFDTITFTPSGFLEFKRYAQTVLLIKSHFK